MSIQSRGGAVVSATAVTSALLLAACGGSSTGTGTSSTSAAATPATSSSASAGGGTAIGCDAAKGKSVGYSEPIPDPNFAQIERIMRATLQPFGVELKTANAKLNPGQQIADINTLLGGGISVLIANPIDPNATRTAFDAARAKNIPIVAQETTVGGPFFTNVSADVEAAAAGGAKDLKAAVGDGEVRAILGPPIAEVLVRENTSFEKAAAANGLKVTDKQTNDKISPEAARAIADAWKQKDGASVKGIWTFNDTSAGGVVQALDGTFAPKIVSINAQPEAIPLVQAGKILATYDIQQDKIAQMLAYSALQALCGKTVPKNITVPVVKYDASNIASYKPLTERGTEPLTSVTFEEKDGKTYLK